MPHYMHKTYMSLLILFFLLIIVWPIPIALATVFYIQKRRLQQTIDAIKELLDADPYKHYLNGK